MLWWPCRRVELTASPRAFCGWQAYTMPISVPCLTKQNATSLIADIGAIKGCVNPVLRPKVYDELIDYNILDPPKRLIGVGSNIIEAGVKDEMPAILTDRCRWQEVRKPESTRLTKRMQAAMAAATKTLSKRHQITVLLWILVYRDHYGYYTPSHHPQGSAGESPQSRLWLKSEDKEMNSLRENMVYTFISVSEMSPGKKMNTNSGLM